jgi:hypothetical protein
LKICETQFMVKVFRLVVEVAEGSRGLVGSIHLRVVLGREGSIRRRVARQVRLVDTDVNRDDFVVVEHVVLLLAVGRVGRGKRAGDDANGGGSAG